MVGRSKGCAGITNCVMWANGGVVMKCGYCGKENEPDAVFCEACGRRLGDAPEASPDAGSETPLMPSAAPADDGETTPVSPGTPEAGEAATPHPAVDDTVPASAKTPEDESETAQVAAPVVPPVPGAAGAVSTAKSAFSKLDSKGWMAVGAAIVAVIIIAVVLMVGGGPSNSSVKDYIKREAEWPTAGAYDEGGTWEISSIDIVKKEKVEADPWFDAYLDGDPYVVTATVTASNGSVDATKTVQASFGKYQGEWVGFGVSTVEASYTPTSGVSEERIAENAGTILSQADSGTSMGLAYLYEDADVSVEDVSFDEDAQTCTATVTYSIEDAFSSAEAVVDATFYFEDGNWETYSVKARAGADEVSYDKLIGTWKGEFKETTAGLFSNCYGAQDSDFTLTITSVDSDSGKVEGTFSGLAHYHENLESDQNSTEGDTQTDEIPFVATLDEGYVRLGRFIESGNYVNIGARYDAPETTEGQITLCFGFGTSNDPDAAMASLCTEANDEDDFLTSTFEDVYTLTKED